MTCRVAQMVMTQQERATTPGFEKNPVLLRSCISEAFYDGSHNMNTPEQCENLQEIRDEIDCIDREIIALLGRRYGYVKAAAKFKTDAGDVKAPERVAVMLGRRRVWAEEHGLSADMVETLYRDLVNYFIREEMKGWKEQQD